jgi:hypothetical protein
MERPTKGSCDTCAWLAKSVAPGGTNPQPMFAVFDETEQYFRDHPKGNFDFVPANYNAQKVGHLTCFRRVADLPKEVDEQGGSWAAVIWKDRKCPKWSKYEPGLSPREYLAEARSQQFETKLTSTATRVTIAVAIVGVIVGLLQLLSITPESIGCQLVKNTLGWLGALSWLTCK